MKRITNSKKKNNNISLFSPKIPQLSNKTTKSKKNINKVPQSQSLKKQDIRIPPEKVFNLNDIQFSLVIDSSFFI